MDLEYTSKLNLVKFYRDELLYIATSGKAPRRLRSQNKLNMLRRKGLIYYSQSAHRYFITGLCWRLIKDTS